MLYPVSGIIVMFICKWFNTTYNSQLLTVWPDGARAVRGSSPGSGLCTFGSLKTAKWLVSPAVLFLCLLGGEGGLSNKNQPKCNPPSFPLVPPHVYLLINWVKVKRLQKLACTYTGECCPVTTAERSLMSSQLLSHLERVAPQLFPVMRCPVWSRDDQHIEQCCFVCLGVKNMEQSLIVPRQRVC